MSLCRSLLPSLIAGMLAWPAGTAAQLADPGGLLPPLERPEPPAFAPPLDLPPPPLPPDADAPLSSRVRVFVRRIELEGNTVFSAEELGRLTAPYENRLVDSAELQALRRALTLYYVERGYLNSGAVLPDQPVEDGVIRFRIVEGRLGELRLEGRDGLPPGYVERRLDLDRAAPLNLEDLRQGLQWLQQDPLIRRVDGELSPGAATGEGVLTLRLEQAPPYRLGIAAANDRAPDVGGERLRLYVDHLNLSGRADVLGLRYGRTEGADDAAAVYRLPLGDGDTALTLELERSGSAVIEETFRALDIESELSAAALGLERTVHRSRRRSLVLGVSLERRHSKTFLLGEPFAFSPGVPAQGPDQGESDVTVLRLRQDWLDRGPDRVLAARSTFSFGLPWLGATDNVAAPDGEFFAWLGQLQWARRFDGGGELLLRADLQLAGRSLLPLEKFAVGGADTVRGYREGLLVRDNGLVASVEYRHPLFRLPLPGGGRGPGDGQLWLAPFVDAGHAWNTDLPTPGPRTVAGAGLGLRWDPGPGVHVRLYWGGALRGVDTPGDDIQDAGLHFRVEAFLP